MFLAIAGSIGSGKTTLTQRLSERMKVCGLYESTQANPYLADFYENMDRYALPLQLRFLATRVAQVRSAQADNIATIQDRTCYEDAEIFAAHLHARGSMDERDWETYQMIAAPLLDDIDVPHLLIYLDRSAQDCARQIKQRARSYEQAIPDDYLGELSARYSSWFDRYARSPKLRIRAENYDFLHSNNDVDQLIAQIGEKLPQRSFAF